MRVRVAGLLLFLPVPFVLLLFTRCPLGVRASLALGVALMLTHRLYARPWALARAGARCLWCASAARNGVALDVREPLGATTWRACSADHAERLRRVLGWAARHARFLQVGILGTLAVFLVGAWNAPAWPSGPAQDDWTAFFRAAIGFTVLRFALLGPRARASLDGPPAVPFPVHIQGLVGTRAVLWLFRVVGVAWLLAATLHALRRAGLVGPAWPW